MSAGPSALTYVWVRTPVKWCPDQAAAAEILKKALIQAVRQSFRGVLKERTENQETARRKNRSASNFQHHSKGMLLPWLRAAGHARQASRY